MTSPNSPAISSFSIIWGGGAVVGGNLGKRGKSAVGPLSEGGRRSGRWPEGLADGARALGRGGSCKKA
ncbi:MAG: hypothetical protein WCW68_13875 [Methanothrix sp.]